MAPSDSPPNPSADLSALTISSAEVEALSGVEVGRVFVGGVVRPSALRSPQRLASLAVTELGLLLVSFIICLGIALVGARGAATARLPLLVGGAALAAVTAVGGWNLYQRQRYGTLRSLARLLDEVDRHNDIVQALQVMDELEAAHIPTLPLPNRQEVVLALQATRASLLSALTTEKILRRHRALIQRRQELFATIETNLATLQQLTVNSEAAEYQQFLQEALAIGLAVQAELGEGK